MSAFARSIMQAAMGLRGLTGPTLDGLADTVVKEVQSNIKTGTNAGPFKTEDAGADPGSPMTPLSAMTLDHRKRKGISGTTPLYATGQLHDSISVIRKGKLRRVVGAKGAKQAWKLKKQKGTDYTGIYSTILKKEIPARNPLGLTEATVDQMTKMVATSLGAGRGVSERHTFMVRL